jgi:malonate decarboxylase epsilon subunit
MGMFDLLPDHRAVDSVFDDLYQVLGISRSELQEECILRNARGIQLALFTLGVASFSVLENGGGRIDVVAGFSIGAFGAAVASGAFSFCDLLPVVALRGELMERSFPSGFGMLALTGLRLDILESLVNQLHTQEEPLYVANINSATQIVVAGKLSALDRLGAHVRKIGRARTQLLNTPTPSHCELLSGVQGELTKALAHLQVREPTRPYLSNTETRIVSDANSIRKDLASNVTHPIRWRDGTDLLQERGVKYFIEVLPSDTLSRLVGKANDHQDSTWVAVSEKGFSHALRNLQRN